VNDIANNYRFLSIDHEIYLHKQGQTILIYLKELHKNSQKEKIVCMVKTKESKTKS